MQPIRSTKVMEPAPGIEPSYFASRCGHRGTSPQANPLGYFIISCRCSQGAPNPRLKRSLLAAVSIPSRRAIRVRATSQYRDRSNQSWRIIATTTPISAPTLDTYFFFSQNAQTITPTPTRAMQPHTTHCRILRQLSGVTAAAPCGSNRASSRAPRRAPRSATRAAPPWPG